MKKRGGGRTTRGSGESARTVAYCALFSAVVFALTRIGFQLAKNVYFNLGEAGVYLVALLLGPRVGALASAIGSALADVSLGYFSWAPLTFLIKGAEAFIVGSLGERGWPSALAVLPGMAVMVSGYSVSALVIYGRGVALQELVCDIVQTSVGLGLAVVLLPLLNKALVGILKGRGGA